MGSGQIVLSYLVTYCAVLHCIACIALGWPDSSDLFMFYFFRVLQRLSFLNLSYCPADAHPHPSPTRPLLFCCLLAGLPLIIFPRYFPFVFLYFSPFHFFFLFCFSFYFSSFVFLYSRLLSPFPPFFLLFLFPFNPSTLFFLFPYFLFFFWFSLLPFFPYFLISLFPCSFFFLVLFVSFFYGLVKKKACRRVCSCSKRWFRTRYSKIRPYSCT